MDFVPFHYSLRLKITLAVTLALILLLGGFAAWQYDRHRIMDMEEAQTQSSATTAIILASLHHAFLMNDKSDLISILDNVSRQPGVYAITLLDANGKQTDFEPGDGAASPVTGAPARAIGFRASALDTATSAFYTAPSGVQILRYTKPIPNESACAGCHALAQPVLGTLVTEYTLAETKYQIDTDLQATLTGGIVIILALAITINLLLSRFVLDRLEQFLPVLQRFGEGDLTPRLAPQGQDEIEQLARRFNQMADGIETRDRENARLYNELERKEVARAYLLHQVIVAQEEEHKHLARELHDDLAQSLTALSIMLQAAIETVPKELRGVQERLAHIQRLAQETMVETSRWIQDLRPRTLDDLGLVPALRAYIDTHFDSRETQVEIQMSNPGERLPPQVEITLFRVLQEALANIAKHAHAHKVQIHIDRYADGTLVVRVEDDGVGFIPARYLTAQDGLRGIGLLGMRERVALLGGTFVIDSTPGRGTRVRVEIPWKQTAP